MRLFGIFSQDQPAPARPEPEAEPTLWADSLGRVAIRSIQILAVLVLTGVALYLLLALRLILIPFLIAIILASALAPIMRHLRRWKVPSALAAILVLVCIFGLFGLIGWLVSWAVINQWDELFQSAREGIEHLRDLAGDLPFTITDEQFEEWQQKGIDFLTSGDVGAGAIQGAGTVAQVATGGVLIAVMLFFFLKDGPEIWEFFLRPLEGENYVRAQRIGRNAVATLGGYARGTAVVAAVDAIGIGIGLLILKVPLAIPLTVIVFLSSFIPLIGAVVASGLAALVALVANGPVTALIVILIAIGVNQIEGNLLQPLVMSRSVNLHALAILIALTAGTILGGIVGALLAVPITAVAWRIISVWHGEESPALVARAKVTHPAR